MTSLMARLLAIQLAVATVHRHRRLFRGFPKLERHSIRRSNTFEAERISLSPHIRISNINVPVRAFCLEREAQRR